MAGGAALLSLVALIAGGCGGSADEHSAPISSQNAVADRFAEALVHGDVAGARALLARPNEGALVYLVRRDASRWKSHEVAVRLPAQRSGSHWKVGFTANRTYKDGRFERASGNLVMTLTPFTSGSRVEYFLYADVRTRHSTHHDALLLPSKR